MHMIKKCGGTPCDRRLDRRKVAMAAAAAFLLFATTAQAAITDFQINFDLSFLTLTGSVDLTNAGGGPAPIAPQSIDFSGNGAIGNKAFYNGDLYVDVLPGSLQFMPTGAHYVNAQGSGGPGHLMGSWLPGGDGYGNAVPTPPDFGNYGFSVPAAGAFARIYDQSLSPSGLYAPNGPRGLSPAGPPGVFFTSVAPEIWVDSSGFQALVSALGNDFTNLTNEFGGGPFPVPLGGTLDVMTGSPVFTPNATVAIWDTNTQTLTINVNGTLKYPISSSPLLPLSQTYTGQLVMTPRVPEPSSMILLGFGAVGLLSCAYRARKRRARTA